MCGCALAAGLSDDYAGPPGEGEAGAVDGAADASDGSAPDDAPGADAPADGGCGPVTVIDETFATGFPPGWTAAGDTDQTAKPDAATPGVQLVPLESFEYGTLFHDAIAVPLGAFSATFRFRVDASSSVVSDGLAFVWLDGTGDVTAATYGQGLGVVDKRSGWAFVLDTYENPDNTDPAAPYYGVVRIDPTRGRPGTYDWHLKSTSPLGKTVFSVTHTARVTLASSQVTATVDGITVLDAVSVATRSASPPAQGNIGITAATGGSSPLAVFVDDLRVTVPNQACPGAFP